MDVYEQYCASNNIPVDESIKKALIKAGISGDLVLSGISLSAASSTAVGSVICRFKSITKLDISDCLLSASSLSLLLQKLTNSQLAGLNLKGNNIFGEGIDALSRFLMKNRSLKILKLEWNNLGASVDGFSQLCHALSSNNVLEILDLRNNELNSECAFELFDAITRNNALKELDLRWNNLGSEGGQSLLSALRSNKSLTDVKVQGNSIPGEVVAAIDASVDHKKVARRIQHEYSQRSQLLSEQIQHIEQQRTNDIKVMAQQNSVQIQSALDQLKDKNRQVCELEVELQESQMIISQLESQLNSLGSELFINREKVDAQNETIKKQEKQIKSLTEQVENNLENFKKKLSDRERELGDGIEELQAGITTERKTRERVDIQLKESLKYIDSLTSEITDYKNKFMNSSSAHAKSLEDERKLYDETVEKLQQEIFSLQAKNLEIAEKTQQAVNSRVSAMEIKIECLENAKAELNAQFLLEKSKWTEEKSAIWAEATEKQMCRILLLTDKMEHIKQDKQRLEQELTLVQITVANLQRENSSLKSELAEPPRKISQLQEELSNERLLSQRLRSEKAEEMRSVDQLRSELGNQKSQLSNSLKQVADLQSRVELMVAQHQRDLEVANWKLQEKSKEISSIRAEEKERAGVLYTALNRYLAGLQSDVT